MATETISEVAFKKGDFVRYKGHMCYESTVFRVGENGLVTIETRYEPRGKATYMSVPPDQLVKSPFKIKQKVRYLGDMGRIGTVEEYRRDGKVSISYGRGTRICYSPKHLVKA